MLHSDEQTLGIQMTEGSSTNKNVVVADDRKQATKPQRSKDNR
jgi:hypothetical protein